MSRPGRFALGAAPILSGLALALAVRGLTPLAIAAALLAAACTFTVLEELANR